MVRVRGVMQSRGRFKGHKPPSRVNERTIMLREYEFSEYLALTSLRYHTRGIRANIEEKIEHTKTFHHKSQKTKQRKNTLMNDMIPVSHTS